MVYREDSFVNVKGLKSSLDRIQSTLEVLNSKVDNMESPSDGKFYARSYKDWCEISGVNVIKTNTYDIRNSSGEKIAEENLIDLMRKVREGNILDTYPIGTQIVVPYIDAVNNTEYELPFNFGTVQEFEREDGSKFEGLGLVAEYCVPSVDFEFDSPESKNPIEDRHDFGNNRWKFSNMRQWLNKSGKNWWCKSYEYDEPPTAISYETSNGFISCLPEDFVNACVNVKTVTKTADVDDNVIDNTYDKFFLVSLSQVCIKNSLPQYHLNDDMEGRYWEYWKNILELNDYVDICGESTEPDERLIRYSVDNHEYSCVWRFRTAKSSFPHITWAVYSGGDLNGRHCERTNTRLLPACVIG